MPISNSLTLTMRFCDSLLSLVGTKVSGVWKMCAGEELLGHFNLYLGAHIVSLLGPQDVQLDRLNSNLGMRALRGLIVRRNGDAT